MIMLTKEQLADMLGEAYERGAKDARSLSPLDWRGVSAIEELRERAIQPLVHRSSGGHDDHGREVE